MQRPLLWAALGLACVLALLTIPNLSNIHRYEDADSIIPTMVSIEHWTPFYWDQGRFGMLIALLAVPIRDPLWNLLFQTQANLWSLFAAMFFLGRIIDPHRRSLGLEVGRAALGLTLTLLVLRNGLKVHHLYMISHPYSVSIALMAGAFAVVRPQLSERPWWRMGAFAVLMALSLWVNEGLAPLSFLWTAILLPPSSWRNPAQWIRAAVCAGFVLGAMAVLRQIAKPYGITPVGFSPLENMPQALQAMTDGLYEYCVHPIALALLLAGAVVALTAGWKRSAAEALQTLWPVAIILTSSAAIALLITSLSWVEVNLYNVRYWGAPILLIIGTAAMVVAKAIGSAPSRWPWLTPAASIAALGVLLLGQYGQPSMSRVRASLDQLAAPLSTSILNLGCTHLLGDPWVVWPQALYFRIAHPSHKLYPITYRSQPMWEKALSMPPDQRRYCAVCGDSHVAVTGQLARLPVMQERAGAETICQLSPSVRTN